MEIELGPPAQKAPSLLVPFEFFLGIYSASVIFVDGK